MSGADTRGMRGKVVRGRHQGEEGQGCQGQAPGGGGARLTEADTRVSMGKVVKRRTPGGGVAHLSGADTRGRRGKVVRGRHQAEEGQGCHELGGSKFIFFESPEIFSFES